MAALRRQLSNGLILAAFIGVAHFFALDSGLFFDDHAHLASLREGDWSFQSAIAASELGRADQVIEMWGAGGVVRVRFFRPVAFWIMRAQYTLLGWPVDGGIGMHLFSLAWHWLAAMLVVTLAYRLFGVRLWALLAGIWFATHPAGTITVYWIACLTELLVAVFALSSILCYGRWSGWWPAGGTAAADPQGDRSTHGSFLLLVAALMLFALGLGCRENAVIVASTAFLGDFCLRPGALLRRGRWGAYAAFTALVIGYLIVRGQVLGGFPLPGPPYLHRPNDPGFLGFVFAKLVCYLLGVFVYLPVLPIDGVDHLREHAVIFYPCLAVSAVVVLVAVAAMRHRRAVWVGGVWTLVGIALMAPFFTSAHHLYLPSAGAAVVLAAMVALIVGRLGPVVSEHEIGTARRAVAIVLVIVIVVLVPFGTMLNGWFLITGSRIEDEAMREILTYGRPLRDGDHLFFVNLAMPANYIKPALENRLGTALHADVLTFSPSVWGMEQSSTIDQLDAHTLTVSVDGDRYMSGLAGQTVLGTMGRTEPFRSGEAIRSEHYDVTIIDADETGIAKLKFTFHRRLSDPSYHFYVGSQAHFAYPLPFESTESETARRRARVSRLRR